MPPTVQTIARGNAVYRAEDSRARDVTKALKQLEGDTTPLTTLMSQLRVVKAKAVKVEWFEKELIPLFDTLAADVSASATTMTVVNYKFFRKEDLVKINNKEVVRVTTTPTSTSVSIKRAVGGVGGTAALAGNSLLIMSSASIENSASRDLLSTQKVGKHNFCQTHREPFALSWHGQNTEVYGGGNDWDTEMAQALAQCKRAMEMSLIHGERFEDTSGAQDQHQTGGVLFYIATNVIDASGDLTEPEFEDFIRICFRYGSDNKVIIMSPKLASVINSFARGKLQTVQSDQKYGVTLTQYQNAGRRVRLAEHKLLTNESLSDFSGIAGYGILLDIGALELAHMGPALVEYEEHIEAKGTHGRQDEYVTVFGLKLYHERKHGLLKGVTG